MLAIFTLTIDINKVRTIHGNANTNVGNFHHDIVE